MEPISLLVSIVAILAGAMITFIVAKNYYERASTDLIDEAEKLRKLNILMLRALEEGGVAKFNRDANGEIIGLVLNGKVTFSVGSRMSAGLS